MDKVSLTALAPTPASGGRARPARQRAARDVRRAPTTLRHNLMALTASTSLDDPRWRGRAAGIARAVRWSPDTSWDGAPAITRHPPPPRPARRRRLRRPLTVAKSAFSGKGKPPWPRSAPRTKRSTVTGPDPLHAATGKNPIHDRRLGDQPVLWTCDSPTARVALVRLIDRFGVGSDSWSR